METTIASKEEDTENNNKMIHHRKPIDWQMLKQNLSEKGAYLLETGIWSDCTFIVGLPPNLKVSHKLLSVAHKTFFAQLDFKPIWISSYRKKS